MAKCSFCSEDLPAGTGKMLVKNDGKIFFYCSKKCENNMKLKRMPAKVNWIRKSDAKKAERAAIAKKK
jgi:large subunit ribosomal protein L24e